MNAVNSFIAHAVSLAYVWKHDCHGSVRPFTPPITAFQVTRILITRTCTQSPPSSTHILKPAQLTPRRPISLFLTWTPTSRKLKISLPSKYLPCIPYLLVSTTLCCTLLPDPPSTVCVCLSLWILSSRLPALLQRETSHSRKSLHD